MNLYRACLAGISLALLACDLTPKDIGKESESNSGGGSSDSGGSDDGVPCSEPEPRPVSQACNPCVCIDDQWACAEQCGPVVCADGEQTPSPDGCNDCECVGGQWGCTKRACAPGWFGDAILVCDPGAPEDPLGIETVVVDGDALLVGVNYGGGCEQHEFGLCWDGSFAESAPVQISTFISHEDHDDPCEASPHQDLMFDLVPLRKSYQEGYQTEHGEISIVLAGWDASISYTF